MSLKVDHDHLTNPVWKKDHPTKPKYESDPMDTRPSEKPTHSSDTPKSKSTIKKRICLQHYFNTNCLRLSPVPEHFVDLIASELVEWVNTTKDAIKFVEFLHQRHIATASFHQWLPHSETLRMAYNYALEVLGTRREKKGLTREYESGMVRSTMPLYDKDWRELGEWRAKLRAKEVVADIPRMVVIEKFVDPAGSSAASDE